MEIISNNLSHYKNTDFFLKNETSKKFVIFIIIISHSHKNGIWLGSSAYRLVSFSI